MQGRANLLAALAAALLLAVPGGVHPAPAAEPGEASGVPLDRLLQLPPSLPVKGEIEKRGGATRDEWQARFAAAREQLQHARKELAGTRADLKDKVGSDGSAWKMTAPGIGSVSQEPTADAGPVDYKLSQDLKRQREDVARAEKQLQELEVEANLAGVPPEWRGADEKSSGPPGTAESDSGS